MTGPANSWQEQIDTGEPFLTAGQQMEKLNMEADYARGVADAANAVPTNWTDSLLTGSAAVLPAGYKYEPTDIEQLLRAIKDRIQALAPQGKSP